MGATNKVVRTLLQLGPPRKAQTQQVEPCCTLSRRPDYKEGVKRNLKANSGRALEVMKVQGQMKPDPSTNSKEAE